MARRSSTFLLLLGSAITAHAQCTIDLPDDTLNLYLGYEPLACATLDPDVNGAQPHTFVWNNGLTNATIRVCATVSEWVYVALLDDTLCYAIDSVFVTAVDARCGDDWDKVLVCHSPPGNPAEAHTLCIGPNAVPAHLAHGCTLGDCGYAMSVEPAEGTHGYTVLVSAAPNPMSSSSTLRVVSLQGQHVVVRALDPMGRVIKVLLDADMATNEDRMIQVDEGIFPQGTTALWIESRGKSERRVQPLMLER